MKKQENLMGVKEAAEYLGVKESTIYRWKLEGKIPCFKVGHLLKFKKEKLDDWLAERELKQRESKFEWN